MLLGKRTAAALARPTTRIPAATAPTSLRTFTTTPPAHDVASSATPQRPTRMPSRVKTPWIEALTKSREEARAAAAVAAGGGPKDANVTSTAAKVDTTPKKMSDSHYSVVLPLAQDKWLLDSYLNATGHIRYVFLTPYLDCYAKQVLMRCRLGSLLMDLDALAGIIAYRHTGDNVTTVTAAVDRITIEHPLMEICDLELSGQVTYATGRSSMEISLQVAKVPPQGQSVKPDDVLITCAFTMVSLDPVTKKPVNVAPLVLETEEEKGLFTKGEENYKAKKALRTRSLLEKAPDDEESNLIHSMWKQEVSYRGTPSPSRQSIETPH